MSQSETEMDSSVNPDILEALQGKIAELESRLSHLATDHGKQLAKYREKLMGSKAEPAADNAPAQAQTPAPADNWGAAITIGARMATLPESARLAIQDIINDGATPAEVTRMIAIAEATASSQQAQQSATPPAKRERGIAGTAAQTQVTTGRPTSWAELMEMKHDPKQRQKYDLLMEDPSFDIDKLAR